MMGATFGAATGREARTVFRRIRCGRTRFVTRIAFAAVMLVWLGGQAGQVGATESPRFDDMATRLVDGIRAHGRWARLRDDADETDRKPRVAIWPYDAEDLPIAPERARRWNDRLRRAMLARDGAGELAFVARTDLEPVVQDVRDSDVQGDIEKPVTVAAREAEADVVVVGRPSLRGGTVHLGYKAIAVGGRILAQAGPVPVGEAGGSGTAGARTLDAVVHAAARTIANRLPGLTELRVAPLTVGETGRTSPFARHLTGRLKTALQDAVDSAVTGQRLKIAPAMDVRALRGLAVKVKDDRDRDGDAYRLTGRIWDLGETVSVHVDVRAPDGRGARWSGRIVAASLPGELAVQPPEPATSAGAHGPLHLRLTSDKGPNPVYRVGESLTLGVRVDRTAHVYCFYRDSAGTVVKVLPNRHRSHLSAPEAGYYQIGGSKSAVKLAVTSPPGQEQMTCYATDRNVAEDLPAAIRSDRHAELPPEVANRLDQLFHHLPDTRLSRATLPITVKPPE